MKIPEGAKTIQLSNSTLWMEEGIVFSTPRSDTRREQTQEQIKEEIRILKEFTGGEKVCLILETSGNSRSPKKEDRDFLAEQLESITKAMAIVTSSPLSRMVANLFFGLKPPAYPAKIFKDVESAKEWIRQYSNKK
jgi:hypothetical protein